MRKPGFLSFHKLAVIPDQASKSPKETLSKLSNASNNPRPIYLEKESNLATNRRMEKMEQWAKLIIRKDDNYWLLDKSRDQRERRPLPLVRKMAARLGKWLRSIPRNIMQRGRWEVAWSCCFLPVYNERDNGTDS